MLLPNQKALLIVTRHICHFAWTYGGEMDQQLLSKGKQSSGISEQGEKKKGGQDVFINAWLLYQHFTTERRERQQRACIFTSPISIARIIGLADPLHPKNIAGWSALAAAFIKLSNTKRVHSLLVLEKNSNPTLQYSYMHQGGRGGIQHLGHRSSSFLADMVQSITKTNLRFLLSTGSRLF